MDCMYVLIKPPASGDDDRLVAAADDDQPVTAADAAAATPSTSRVDPDSGHAATTTFEHYDSPTNGGGDDDDDAADYADDDDVFNSVVDRYMSKRNINMNDVCDPKYTNKPVIEYVNLKYVENNFRTIGLNETFDNYDVTLAQTEFEFLEKWFIRKKKFMNGKKYIRDLRLPMFSHLYLNLYSEKNREPLLAFLDAFKYLFIQSKSNVFLEELKNVTDINNLSPYLSLFRKNKYVFFVSPEFLTNLYAFFQQHYILKVVFNEWFDINYSIDEDPAKILSEYNNKQKSKLENQTNHAKRSNSNNNQLKKDSPSTSGDNLFIKNPNLSENKNGQQINDSQKNITNNKENEKKQQRKPKKINGESGSNQNNSSSNSSSEDSYSNLCFSDEEIVKCKHIRNKYKLSEPLSYKNSYHMNVLYNTKIEVKKFDDDSYLNTTRQIALINCKKLSSTLLTTNLKNVAAGSLDSLIYLWERTKFDLNNLLNSPLDKSNNFIEYHDRSTAIILRGHGGSIFDLAEISSSEVLLSASDDKTFRVWSLKSKCCLEIFDAYEHSIWCIATCPISFQVVTGSFDGTSCLWLLDYKSPVRIFVGHLDDVLVIKIHPNQVLIATGSSDKTIRVYEIVVGECQRLLLGHSDYISCLEFHMGNPNILASACGAGEVIVWDLPSGNIVWKFKMTDVMFSDLVWLTSDVLLASINTGVILKCDVKKNYINTYEMVEGFVTRLNPLMSLKIVDHVTYAIGIAGHAVIPNSSFGRRRLNVQTSQERRAPSSISQPNAESNNNVGGGGGGGPSSGTVNLAACDSQGQLNTNPNSASTESLQTNLQCSPFGQTSDETTKSGGSEHQSTNIKSAQKGSKKQPTASIRKKIVPGTSGASSSSQTNVPPPPPLNVTAQHQLGGDGNRLETNLTALSNRTGNNVVVPQRQQQQQSTRPEVQQTMRSRLTAAQQLKQFQQTTSRQQVQRPKAPSAAKKTNVQQRQHKPQQQQPFGDKKLSKTNVARLSDLTAQQMSMAGPSLSCPGGGVRFAPRTATSSQKPTSAVTAKQASLEKLPPEEYARLRKAVMASLLQTNPEMFARGQTVIGEITRSQPSVDVPQTEQPPQNDENL